MLTPSGSGRERERENRETGEASPVVTASAAPIHSAHFLDGYPLCWSMDATGEHRSSRDMSKVTCPACQAIENDWDEDEDGPNPDDLTPAEHWQDIADDIAFERWREERRS